MTRRPQVLLSVRGPPQARAVLRVVQLCRMAMHVDKTHIGRLLLLAAALPPPNSVLSFRPSKPLLLWKRRKKDVEL